jgi:hypothetical protein
MNSRLHSLFLGASLLLACSGGVTSSNATPDSAMPDVTTSDLALDNQVVPDSMSDAVGDVPRDTVGDQTTDVAQDATLDVVIDTTPDASMDTTPDVRDVAVDIAPDVAVDATSDVRDVAVDATPDATMDVIPDVRDAAMDTVDASPDDVVDVTPGEPIDLCLDRCVCADPGASCRRAMPDPRTPERLLVCVHRTSACSAILRCPTGYTCNGTVCECSDPAVCGVACTTGSCTCGYVCNASGRCVPPPPCAFSDRCASGQVCRRGQCTADIPSGTAADGTSCGSTTECSGGSCAFRTCTRRCARNSDCAPGLVCAESDNLENNGCVLPETTSCATGCTQPTHTCSLYRTPAGYCAQWCTRNADCPGGRCVASTNNVAHPASAYLLYRVCLPSMTRTCTDDEIEVETTSSTERLCSRGVGCLVETDCPTSHPVCVTTMGISVRGVCARRI